MEPDGYVHIELKTGGIFTHKFKDIKYHSHQTFGVKVVAEHDITTYPWTNINRVIVKKNSREYVEWADAQEHQ
jgi:hypothetical protein